MKNIFVLALALIMSCTFAFAQSQSPYSKGKYFGIKIVEIGIAEDEAATEKLVYDYEIYCDEYIETEEDLENFFKGIENGIYVACKEYGLGEDVAEMIVESLFDAMLEEFDFALYL